MSDFEPTVNCLTWRVVNLEFCIFLGTYRFVSYSNTSALSMNISRPTATGTLRMAIFPRVCTYQLSFECALTQHVAFVRNASCIEANCRASRQFCRLVLAQRGLMSINPQSWPKQARD